VTVAQHHRAGEMPTLLRVLIAVGLPMAGAATVAGTFLGKEIILFAGWLAVCVAVFLLAQPVIGIALMTAAYLMAAYPTLLQTLGVLTVNNLLGVCLLGLMVLRIIETRDFSFLRNRQVRILAVIGVLLMIGTAYSTVLFPTLQATVGKMKVLDKSSTMIWDFVTRLVYLVFFMVFVRDRRDIRTMFVVFMIALFIAVPSALYNMATGTLNRGFRLSASVTSGANPNRLAMICLMEIACWWFWARARPGFLRQVLAMGAMAACTMVIFGTGSRSGLLGVGMLGLLLQTSPKRFRVPSAQIALLGAAAAFAVATMVPVEAWERMITFNPQKGEIGATSNTMREETIFRAFEVAQDYPLFGIGIGNFREVSRQVYQDKYFRPPHNSYLWAASEGGIFVLAMYLVLFWVTWRDLSVVTRLAHRDPEIGAAAGGVRVIFLLYFFFSLFADLWLNPITYAMIGLIVVMRRYVESLPELEQAIVLPGPPAGRGRLVAA
jgi:O-antigen ligase